MTSNGIGTRKGVRGFGVSGDPGLEEAGMYYGISPLGLTSRLTWQIVDSVVDSLLDELQGPLFLKRISTVTDGTVRSAE